ncbi:MAG: hypothetical protein WCJ35_02710 [Planctomycetota bacterium]
MATVYIDRFVDPVVAEIHASRAAMLKAAGGDIDVLMQQVADRQQLSNRRIIRESLRNRKEAGVDRSRPLAFQ